jgi:uncharacterized membrane protein
MKKWQGVFWSLAVGMAVLLTGCGSDKVFDNNVRGPLSVTTIPANGDTNVSVKQIISATFNKMVEPATVNSATIYLKKGTELIDGALTLGSAQRTAVFVPTEDLDMNTTYQFYVTTGVETPSGETLLADHVTTFTTGYEIPPVFSSVMVSVDSAAVSVDSNDSELLNPIVGGLLGTGLQADVLTTKGVADVRLGLMGLLGGVNDLVGAESVGELLDAPVAVEDLLGVTSGLLGDQGETDAQGAVDELSAKVSEGDLNGEPVKLSSIMRFSDETRDMRIEEFMALKNAQNSQLKTLDLITTLNDILNPLLGQSIELPLNLPPLLNSMIKLQVVSKPVIGEMRVGDSIHTAVTRLYLDLGVGEGGLGGILGLLGDTNATTQEGEALDLYADIVRLPLYIEVGSSEATLTSITSESIEMNATNGLIRLYLGDIDEDVYFSQAATLGPDDFEAIDIVNVLGLIKITAKGFIASEGNSEVLSFLPAPAIQTSTVKASAGSDVNGLLGTLLTTLELKIVLLDAIELDLTPLTQGLAGVLGELLMPLTGGLLDSVSSLLGVHTGKADITLQGLVE